MEEAIKLWRDTFKLNLNQSRRRDIQLTVKDLDLWRDVITNWGYWKEGKWIKFNPLAVGHQLSEYERRVQKRASETNRVQRQGVSDSRSTWIPERGNRNMLEVREGAGVHAGRGYKNLDEILAAALRAQDRS